MSRPVPEPDERSAGYWEAAASHVLTVAECSRCNGRTMPPDAVCPRCRSVDPQFRFVPVSGEGTVRSWTVIRQSFLPGFDVPFVLVDVALDDAADVRLIGRLVDGADAPLRQGDRVAVTFEDVADGVAVPAFTLAAQR